MTKRPALNLKKPKPIVDDLLEQDLSMPKAPKIASSEGGKKSIKVFMDLNSHENLRIHCVRLGITLNDYLFEAINIRLGNENAGFSVTKP